MFWEEKANRGGKWRSLISFEIQLKSFPHASDKSSWWWWWWWYRAGGPAYQLERSNDVYVLLYTTSLHSSRSVISIFVFFFVRQKDKMIKPISCMEAHTSVMQINQSILPTRFVTAPRLRWTTFRVLGWYHHSKQKRPQKGLAWVQEPLSL